MSDPENVALVRRFFEEFCNGRQAALADELLTADHVYHDPQIPNVVGPQALVEALAVFQQGLEGHWGVEEVRVAALQLFRLADGKIAEQWCVWDTLGMLQQLGAAPMPAAPGD